MKKHILLVLFLLLLTGCGTGGGSIEVSPPPPATITLPLTPYTKEGPSTPCLIEEASGAISFEDPANGTLPGKITLSGLKPGREYMLTLNEKEGQPEQLKGYHTGNEGQYDFMAVSTESDGRVIADFRLPRPLPTGSYHVKFFVKDVNDDYCIVLYNDNFIFTIR